MCMVKFTKFFQSVEINESTISFNTSLIKGIFELKQIKKVVINYAIFDKINEDSKGQFVTVAGKSTFMLPRPVVAFKNENNETLFVIDFQLMPGKLKLLNEVISKISKQAIIKEEVKYLLTDEFKKTKSKIKIFGTISLAAFLFLMFVLIAAPFWLPQLILNQINTNYFFIMPWWYGFTIFTNLGIPFAFLRILWPQSKTIKIAENNPALYQVTSHKTDKILEKLGFICLILFVILTSFAVFSFIEIKEEKIIFNNIFEKNEIYFKVFQKFEVHCGCNSKGQGCTLDIHLHYAEKEYFDIYSSSLLGLDLDDNKMKFIYNKLENKLEFKDCSFEQGFKAQQLLEKWKK